LFPAGKSYFTRAGLKSFSSGHRAHGMALAKEPSGDVCRTVIGGRSQRSSSIGR
jgi:hypothetical protein